MTISLAKPEDIETLLNAQWNAAIIAKPTFKNEFLGETVQEANTVTYSWDTIDFKDDESKCGLINDIQNIFEIGIIAETSANALLILSEVRRITAAKTDSIRTWHRWHIDNAIPLKVGHYVGFICTMVEYIFEVV